MNQERLYTVLLEPHFSEKVSGLGEKNNQYGFKVAGDASKPEIPAAVEAIWGVDVKSVNTLVTKGKTKRWKGKPYKRSDVKKAIVRLAEGQSIDITEGVR